MSPELHVLSIRGDEEEEEEEADVRSHLVEVTRNMTLAFTVCFNSIQSRLERGPADTCVQSGA